jgi:hypothetical protein
MHVNLGEEGLAQIPFSTLASAVRLGRWVCRTSRRLVPRRPQPFVTRTAAALADKLVKPQGRQVRFGGRLSLSLTDRLPLPASSLDLGVVCAPNP